MSNNRNSKGDSVVAAKQLIAGAEKHLSNTAPAVFGGGSFTADQIASKLFGMKPKSGANVSAEATVAAVAKRKATRAARHTMGSKQKQGIKGDVQGVVVVPVTASAPSVTVTSPSTPRDERGCDGAPPRTA